MILFASAFLVSCSATATAPVESDPRIAKVEAFRELRSMGDREAARALLSADARIWWGERDGPGSPWSLEGGPWSDWDDHFDGSAKSVTPWTADGERVWADILENNDYYRLTESQARAWRAVYFLDNDGAIAGFLVASLPRPETDSSRADEFEAWAVRNRGAEAEYLMPGGEIDPTGDRPARMRSLLNEWRADVGLPALD